MRKLPIIYVCILSLQSINIDGYGDEGDIATRDRLNMNIEIKDQSNITIDIVKDENDCKCKQQHTFFNVECKILKERCECILLNDTMECDKPECSFVKPSKDHSRCICAEDFPIALCDICIRYFTSAAPSCAPLELLRKEDQQMRTRIGIILFLCTALLFIFCVYCVYSRLKRCIMKSKQSMSLPKGEGEELNTKETLCV
uniref:EGF-like domain-containing protein n=1 Tax=Ascaris lumbricoides TaxID=6252 RepID=A0A0M3IG84_ASCLU